jgi:hypothetical protein
LISAFKKLLEEDPDMSTRLMPACQLLFLQSDWRRLDALLAELRLEQRKFSVLEKSARRRVARESEDVKTSVMIELDRRRLTLHIKEQALLAQRNHISQEAYERGFELTGASEAEQLQ